ncbi:MAG: FAD-binding domain-containing protein [Pseudomonadota bacterium]
MTTDTMLPGIDRPAEAVSFEPTREAGLVRLDRFVARAGRHYASQRNYDFGPERRENVSALSPWIRHRLITEEEVLRATLARHAPSSAEKFIQEVFWRTYFKGWLEQRPSVWAAYQDGLAHALEVLEKDRALAIDYKDAVAGQTGIDGFDQWAGELVETGYLHNHARMWFASIWIFTLRLPWELGADFFLRHLMDGDPASNTLSWRWVAGLHTKGKTYQARVSNISKYTEGRFRPEYQLSNTAEPLVEERDHPKVPIPLADPIPEGDFVLLVTEEEGRFEDLLPRLPAATLGLLAIEGRSPLAIGDMAQGFARGALTDALSRFGGDQPHEAEDWAEPIITAAEKTGVTSFVTAYAPVGPVRQRLEDARNALASAGLTLHQIRRDYDDLAWPHATKGFFALKQKIPQVLRGLGLAG